MKSNPLIPSGMAVVVLGLGVSGMAAVRYLHAQGARVLVSETRDTSALSVAERELKQNCCAGFEGGGHTRSFIDQGEMIVVSPGVPPRLEVLEKCRNAGIPIVGELALAAPVLQCKVVAVTGTNGKTTVVTLIGELLQAAGKKVSVCGNIGRPLLDMVQEEDDIDVAVVEVSSFQLYNSGDFRPDIGVILNISPDHLDWHGSLYAYAQAKARIFANQSAADTAIICSDSPMCLELATQLENIEPVLFGRGKQCQGYVRQSEVYMRRQGRLEKYDLTGSVFDNAMGSLNSAAAIMAARYAGCDRASIEITLRAFQGLPHRMELVDVLGGVQYCNDSKATNTGAVISALHQARGRIILIAGGRDKGDDYNLLRAAVEKKVIRLVLIGEAAVQIGRHLEDIVETEYADSLDEAVAKAGAVACYGDTVLLSPACASFDMFDSYAHRGQVFKESVARLRSTLVTQQLC
ncbi:MAG: UDP-N-acetylmuramoyl-L-alanine--D-glutamate ligase [Desulfopila sp.]